MAIKLFIANIINFIQTCYIRLSSVFCLLFHSGTDIVLRGNQVKEDEMGKACSTLGGRFGWDYQNEKEYSED
jgi:hypothetical protein